MTDKPTNEPKCASCGVAWTEHLGATGLCSLLAERRERAYAAESRVKALEAASVPATMVVNRDALGRCVREAWVRWAKSQPNPKASWLIPYDGLNESDKEADRQIAEAVAAFVRASSDRAEVEKLREAVKALMEFLAESPMHARGCAAIKGHACNCFTGKARTRALGFVNEISAPSSSPDPKAKSIAEASGE